MSEKRFICNDCGKIFKNPIFYEETHGLCFPPYERIAACPKCNGVNFSEYEIFVEKIDVAERILTAIRSLNNFSNEMRNVLGCECKNSDFCDAENELYELINDIFDFITIDVKRKILNLKTENEVKSILMYLKGEL